MAKSGRLELGDNILTDIIGRSSTTVTKLACQAIEFGEKNVK